MPGPWWRRAGFFLLSPARGREELEQRQRLLERRVRRVKRWVQGMKTAMDGAAADDIRAELEDKYRKLALRLQEKNQAYREFCRQNDLKPYQERLAIARWDRKQAAAATAAARKAERAAALTSSENGGIIDQEETPREKPDVHTIGRIDREKYRGVTEDIRTDEVIITDERIAHIKEHHPNDFERYAAYMADMVEHPQYILEANKPNTAFLLKEYAEDNERFQLILRLAVKGDVPGYKNSVITFLKVEEKRFKRYLRTKKTIYKAE